MASKDAGNAGGSDLPPKIDRKYRLRPLLILRRWYRADLYRPGILLGCVGLFFAALGLFWSFQSFDQPSATELQVLWLGILCMLVGPIPMITGWFILWTANPETYARISLAGRPIDEVLFLLARDARKACKAVSQRIGIRERHLQGSFDPKRVWRPCWVRMFGMWRLISRSPCWEELLKKRAKTVCKRLERGNKKQKWLLRRIETMKYRVGDDFNIPIRRLCDHVLQYSPVIHRDRTRKHLRDWEKLRDVDADSLKNRACRVWLFAKNTLRRIRYLDELLAFRDLHPFILSFSATYSSSGSLQTYAEALQHVASRRRWGGWRPWPVRETCQRLAFLYRKQRAHPGFSLHEQLRSALENLGFKHRPGYQALEIMTQPKSTVAQATSDEAAPQQMEQCLVKIEDFQKIPDQLTSKIVSNRDRAAHCFVDWFEHKYSAFKPSLADKINPALYIVSHGYSRNVLQVLLHLEGCPTHCTRGGQGDHGSLRWLSSGRARVFFYLTPDDDAFDTRLMEYEVREAVLEEERSRDPRVTKNWTAGDHNVLLNLLRPGDEVLILLGAEVFDEGRRVVHPRGMPLNKFIQEIEEIGRRHGDQSRIGVKVAVIAEEYKRKDSVAQEAHFYQQHFDRVDVYPANTVNWIFTENGKHP